MSDNKTTNEPSNNDSYGSGENRDDNTYGSSNNDIYGSSKRDNNDSSNNASYGSSNRNNADSYGTSNNKSDGKVVVVDGENDLTRAGQRRYNTGRKVYFKREKFCPQ
ncbi:hypothetical protein Agabi119p4_11202 [Agaricus bisporus var. burnettii]|uniref:Uncharacterized protein n=1 Tax=Agaricus bisporus var. burnettii TaxID=192524 RepID=A0A8H7EVY9_AGABI|nr:hypothetical protein Agabi119p4_11202 [Agaricus bisporus var. burnettii]